ncbi:hypothetical protein M011DRAFT_22590 [Sporormia fimetaria CBS 119925]|uniref:RING-type domain-containing protein n=1 Tax=Sporormia fimetaria CBS 119925 TaxID=1340428 RepID=A0A6A6VRD3_9PLEO|nr:hypothetical protein M011DRAFT_22590 [Sporormia fimetaria CBS 119925]
MICPHTWTAVRSSEWTEEEQGSKCIVCYESWSAPNDSDGKVFPGRIAHCGHLICHTCMKQWRTISLDCPYRCGIAPLDLVSCAACVEWESSPASMRKRVILIRRHFLFNLEFELQGLAEDDDYFEIPRANYKKLIASWREKLAECEGQYQRWYEFAEYLDPIRGADVIHDDAIHIWGRDLLREIPDRRLRGYLDPHPRLEDYPVGHEPWISTIIRRVLNAIHNEENIEVMYREEGLVMDHHDMHPERHEDEDGTWWFPWPIHCIRDHLVDVEGYIQYQVEFLGFPRDGDLEWVRRENIGKAVIWQKYDAENGINHDDPPEGDQDGDSDEDTEMSEGSDMNEDDGSGEDTKSEQGMGSQVKPAEDTSNQTRTDEDMTDQTGSDEELPAETDSEECSDEDSDSDVDMLTYDDFDEERDNSDDEDYVP